MNTNPGVPDVDADPAAGAISAALALLRERTAFKVTATPNPTQRVIVFHDRPEDYTLDFTPLVQSWSQTTPDPERHRLLRSWVATILGMFQIPAFGREQLVPMIRHAAKAQWDSDMLAAARGWGSAPPAGHTGFWAVPFAGDLVVMIGVDLPESTLFCTMIQLADMDPAPNGLLAQAMANLPALMRNPKIGQLNDIGLHAIEFPATSWITPSALLLPDLLDHAMEQVGITSALFAAPAQEGIVFCDASLAHASQMMAWAVGAYRKSDRLLSDCVFARAKGDVGLELIGMVHETASE